MFAAKKGSGDGDTLTATDAAGNIGTFRDGSLAGPAVCDPFVAPVEADAVVQISICSNGSTINYNGQFWVAGSSGLPASWET